MASFLFNISLKKKGVNVLTKWKSTKEIMKSESAIFIDVISWNYINEFNKKFKKKRFS